MPVNTRHLGWQVIPCIVVLVYSCCPIQAAAQGSGSSVQLSPGDLSFGSQVTGTLGAPQIEAVTVQNSNAAGITFNSVVLAGKDSADFSVQSDTCSGANLTSGSCEIGIVFQPTAVGNRSAVLRINDDASGSPQTFILQGKGVAPKLNSVVIGPSNPSVVSDSQFQLTAQGIYNDGTQKDITNAAIWTSSDQRVATVQQGLVTGVRSGKAFINAALQGVADRQELDVQYQIVFTRQPHNTPVSQEIVPGITVQVLDNGSPVGNLTVTIDLGPNAPNPAVLSGKRKQDTGQDGTATFQHLKLDYFGNGYALVASTFSPGGPSSALSASFNETRVGDPCLGPNPACSSGCPDADGDGLNDAWEIAGGIDINGDGVIDEKHDLILPDADPDKPDVYVKYDYMVATTTSAIGTPPHSHQPPEAAIQQVVDAFATHGVTLHIDPRHDVIPEVLVTTLDANPAIACAGSDFVTMRTLRARYLGNRKWAYHYGVFAHNATLPDTGTPSNCPADAECASFPDPLGSGTSELPGSSFIVAFGADVDQGFTDGIERWAGTFMHELGHNFGLKHGSLAAPAPQTCLTYKPNYVSVMDYSYQNGIGVAAQPGSATPRICNTDTDCPVGSHCTDDLGGASGGNVCYRADYSREKLLDLNEFSLNEPLGVDGPLGDIDIVRYYAFGNLLSGPSVGPIDWNGDGNAMEANEQVDLDNSGAANETLFTANDWEIAKGEFSNFNFKFQCTTAFAAGAGEAVLAQVQSSSITAELGLNYAREHHILHPPAAVSLLSNLACLNGSVAAAPPGTLQMALAGSASLDVNQVELSSLSFHGARPANITVEDVNNDGIPDLLLQFRRSEVRWPPNAARVRLTGWLKNSRSFVGEAELSIGCPR